MNSFNDEAIKWPCFIIYIYIFTWLWLCHGFCLFMVILRSTTSPYGRPVTEVTYGKMLLSLHRDSMGVDSSGKVVGVSTWCRPCRTYPDQHQCGLNVFSGFLYKTYVYVWCFQNLYVVQKEHWWSLTSSWPDEVQRVFFDRPLILLSYFSYHRRFSWNDFIHDWYFA